MAKQPAQNWMNAISPTIAKANLTGIVANGTTTVNQAENPVAGDELTGELVIEDYPNLEEIFLNENEITKLTIKNCPKLKKINVSLNATLTELNIDDIDPSGANKLEELDCGGSNHLTKVSFKNCKNLKNFNCPNTPTLDRLEKMDGLENIQMINMENSGKVRLMHEVKYQYVNAVVNEVKDMLGIPHTDNLPTLPGKNGGIDVSKLRDQMQAAANPQATAAKDQAKKEAKEAKEKLGGVETERDQLKQQWETIRTELGLGSDATQQKIIDKIKELKGRPTTSCTHTDYDTIKSQKDSLQTELNSKKRKITELENDNKENEGVKKVKFGDLGIKLSSEQQNKIKNASSSDLERVSNEILKTEFTKLQKENDSSFYLNVGLGTLAIGSLILLGWIIMRQNVSLKEESNQEKVKKS